MSIEAISLMPKNKEELVKCLSHADERTCFAAGCTDLIPSQSYLKGFSAFVDLTHVCNMNLIEIAEDCLVIGATATFADIAKNPYVQSYANALALAASQVGSSQIRNRATIGGNVANASPAADSLPALVSLDATAEVLGCDESSRMIPVMEMIKDINVSVLRPREVIWAFRIPLRPHVRSAFVKVGGRKRVTISRLNLAMSVEVTRNRLKRARIYLGTLGPRPLLADKACQVCENAVLESFPLDLFLDALADKVDEAIPTRPSRAYKRVAVRGLGQDILNLIASWECLH
ncbi:FAD binding domain-containing protein [Acetomicrobium sp. UBA5826]|uniref:FAD binding domain-containing protein n=1 Tax=Acetomicrobium sp. UBA5826 TaxID=1946039 RepID=UPI0025797348|nr:FAD binding domain-containing protein [Acetomicrobium sp. UBA5826]